MIEMYWLTRIGVINCLCQVLAITGLVTFIIAAIFVPLIINEVDDEEKARAWVKRWTKPFFIVWFVSCIGCVFIPSKRELIAIYGLGTTIDYIKSNDKVKQLPDKAVDALCKYLDSQIEDNDESK